jgi:uncharacterized protein (DUF58 family)
MQRLFVRLSAVTVYLFLTTLAYLAGIYVARIFYFLYLLLLFVPLFSLLQTVITLIRLRYLQDFETEHPVKGQSIDYRLSIANESFLSTCIVKIRFKATHPDLQRTLEDLSTVFAPRATVEMRYRISCPYRGIYTVGLESFVARDLLGWLEVGLPVYHRTFYVYPRIVDLESHFAGNRSYGSSRVTNAGREDDVALIEGLSDYRAGLSVKHLAWKKYYATGRPFLKTFGKSSEPGITLYLDLRREAPPDPIVLEAEDCSIEIAVALVKYFLAGNISIAVKAMGLDPYVFKGSAAEDFQEFYRHTINLIFRKGASPTALFEADRKRSIVSGAVLFITHLLDPEVLTLVETDREGSIGAVFNQSSMPVESRMRLQSFRAGLNEAERRLFLVRNPETIREDLGW